MTAKRFRHIAVLDIGKTNAKVVVVDGETGKEVATAKAPNPILAGPPYPHHDIEALWAFALDAFSSFAQSPGFDAISITAHGASAVLLDADGALALPMLDYEHEYPDAVRAAYEALRPAFSESFSPRLSGGLNIGAQLHYQKSMFPEAFGRVRTIMTYPQYWAWRLTGIASNELTSLGCHTDLWNPKTSSYSPLVDRLGIRALMAPIRSAFDVLGPILPDISREIGLTKAVPVYCGIHDSNASLLPHLVNRQGAFTVVSTGTWVISFGVGGDLDHLDPARDTLANVDAYGRPVPSSRFMGGREFEMLAAEIGPVPQQDIDAAVGSVVEKGIFLLPSIVGGSGPFPGRQPRWIGAENATPAERLATVSLYLALMTDAGISLLGARGPLFVEGPFAFNRNYLRALSTFSGSEVTALPGSTGTSQGAAYLAGMPLHRIEVSPEKPFSFPMKDYRRRWYEALAEAG